MWDIFHNTGRSAVSFIHELLGEAADVGWSRV